MGLRPYYLGDTSALARLHHPRVTPRLVPLIESGLVARCTPTDLEAGYSSKNQKAHHAMRARRAVWPFVSIGQEVLDRAVDVQDQLVETGRHRGAKIADLLIAAAAERAGLVVLHYDRDYDLVASVTGQSTEWVVPPGTIS